MISISIVIIMTVEWCVWIVLTNIISHLSLLAYSNLWPSFYVSFVITIDIPLLFVVSRSLVKAYKSNK